MFSKSYSIKSENNFIAASKTFLENAENELNAYPTDNIGSKEWRQQGELTVFSSKKDKLTAKKTMKFTMGVLSVISDEIYDGNRNDYDHFIKTSFKILFPSHINHMVKEFKKNIKTPDDFYLSGRRWGKDFYSRYIEGNLAKAQKHKSIDKDEVLSHVALAKRKKDEVLSHIALAKKRKEKEAKNAEKRLRIAEKLEMIDAKKRKKLQSKQQPIKEVDNEQNKQNEADFGHIIIGTFAPFIFVILVIVVIYFMYQ